MLNAVCDASFLYRLTPRTIHDGSDENFRHVEKLPAARHVLLGIAAPHGSSGRPRPAKLPLASSPSSIRSSISEFHSYYNFSNRIKIVICNVNTNSMSETTALIQTVPNMLGDGYIDCTTPRFQSLDKQLQIAIPIIETQCDSIEEN